MIKRIVVAGGRDYNNYEEAKKYIEFCIGEIKNKYTLFLFQADAEVLIYLGNATQKKMIIK